MPEAAARAGAVVLCVQPALVRLASDQAATIANLRVVAHGTRLPRSDAHAYLLSLPLLLNRPDPWSPPSGRYLGPPAPADPPLPAPRRVGVVWAGSPNHEDDRHRSIDPSLLAPLLARTQITWLSLQPGAGLPGVSAGAGGDFAATAATIDGLDLLISVDTSVAHLAGALGRPVWTLLARRPDWRWGTQGDTTPWYPTMHLFRQDEEGGWPLVIAAVAAALDQYWNW